MGNPFKKSASVALCLFLISAVPALEPRRVLAEKTGGTTTSSSEGLNPERLEKIYPGFGKALAAQLRDLSAKEPSSVLPLLRSRLDLGEGLPEAGTSTDVVAAFYLAYALENPAESGKFLEYLEKIGAGDGLRDAFIRMAGVVRIRQEEEGLRQVLGAATKDIGEMVENDHTLQARTEFGRIFDGLAGLSADPLPVPVGESAPARRFKNKTELSLVTTSGNSDTFNFSLSNEFAYSFDEQLTLEIEARALRSSTDGKLSAERYSLSPRLERKFGEGNKDFLYAEGGWERDRFAGIENRYNLGAGYGRVLVDNDLHRFKLSGGLAAFMEEKTGEARSDIFPAAAAAMEYLLKKPKIPFLGVRLPFDFEQKLSSTQDLTDSQNMEMKSVSGIVWDISTHLALRMGLEFRYDKDPAPGAEEWDRTFTTGLIINY